MLTNDVYIIINEYIYIYLYAMDIAIKQVRNRSRLKNHGYKVLSRLSPNKDMICTRNRNCYMFRNVLYLLISLDIKNIIRNVVYFSANRYVIVNMVKIIVGQGA